MAGWREVSCTVHLYRVGRVNGLLYCDRQLHVAHLLDSYLQLLHLMVERSLFGCAALHVALLTLSCGSVHHTVWIVLVYVRPADGTATAPVLDAAAVIVWWEVRNR